MPIVRMPCINPGCGSDLVREDVSLVSPRTGRPAEVRSWALQAALLIVCCAALAAVQLLRPSSTRLVLDFCIIVGFAGLSLATLALLRQPRIVARLVPSVRQHSYTCQICGYKWQTRDDALTTSPDPISVDSPRHATEGSQLPHEDAPFEDQGHEKENKVEPIAP